jgi:hypothetical protein
MFGDGGMISTYVGFTLDCETCFVQGGAPGTNMGTKMPLNGKIHD